MVNNQTEPDLELLPLYGLFALVVKHQSFSEAARLSGLARSAVSQRIQRLEAHAQTQLLRRTTRRVTPTEAGLRLFERCLPLLDQAQLLSGCLQMRQEEGPLRVNAPLSLVHACLGELLVRFQTELPGATVDLSLDNRTVDLLETRDDVVVRVSHELPADLVARKLSQTTMRVVGAPAYLARAGVPEAPHELVRHACLRYTASSGSAEWRFGSGKRSYTLRVDGPFSASDGSALHQFARAGMGLAVLPTFMVADDLRTGALVPVLEEWARPPLTVWAILPAGRRASRRARLLAEFLARHLDGVLPRA
jgi:DNA-binding transcriptional LysR family regulator